MQIHQMSTQRAQSTQLWTGGGIPMSRDAQRLAKRLREVGADGFHLAAASILLSVNGIKNALEYVNGLEERGLVPPQFQKITSIKSMEELDDHS